MMSDLLQSVSDYWASTNSTARHSRPAYQTPELEALLRQNQGIDAALLSVETGVPVPFIKAYQRQLGLRKITGNGVARDD